MQFSSIIATALLSTAALAAPAKRAATVKSMAAADNAEWTFQSFTRACNSGDTSCQVTFGIDTNNGAPVTACNYTVTGSPASQKSVSNVLCGAYTIGSTWSDQFGASSAFTTWSVHNNSLIAYPAYSDSDLSSGKAVSPDRSFPAQAFSG